MLKLFSVLIVMQFLIVILHDLIDIPGWVTGTQVRAVVGRTKFYVATAINAVFPAIAAYFALWFWSRPKPAYVYKYWAIYCTVTVVSAILMWYVPYLFGATGDTKQQYAQMYPGTIHVLPPRGDNPRPNLFHILLHLLFAATLMLSVALLVASAR
jgi:hypothetical protein